MWKCGVRVDPNNNSCQTLFKCIARYKMVLLCHIHKKWHIEKDSGVRMDPGQLSSLGYYLGGNNSWCESKSASDYYYLVLLRIMYKRIALQITV